MSGMQILKQPSGQIHQRGHPEETKLSYLTLDNASYLLGFYNNHDKQCNNNHDNNVIIIMTTIIIAIIIVTTMQ